MKNNNEYMCTECGETSSGCSENECLVSLNQNLQ